MALDGSKQFHALTALPPEKELPSGTEWIEDTVSLDVIQKKQIALRIETPPTHRTFSHTLY
jgi:hypothetical protein